MARAGFRFHRKFRELVRLLGEPAPHCYGYLHFLWEAGYQTLDPYLGDSREVAKIAEYPDSHERLTEALRAARLIDEIAPGIFQTHDLIDNAPDYVKKRYARKLHDQRTNGGQTPDPLLFSALIQPPSGKDARRSAIADSEPTAISTPLNCNPQNQPLSLPLASAVAGPIVPGIPGLSAPRTAESAANDDPVVLTFPVVGRGAVEWHLRQSLVADFNEAFPRVDILAACRHALQWCRANPRRQKTATGMLNFLTNWLSRAQNRGECLRVDTPLCGIDYVAKVATKRQQLACDQQTAVPIGNVAKGLKGTLR